MAITKLPNAQPKGNHLNGGNMAFSRKDAEDAAAILAMFVEMRNERDRATESVAKMVGEIAKFQRQNLEMVKIVVELIALLDKLSIETGPFTKDAIDRLKARFRELTGMERDEMVFEGAVV